MLSQDFWEMFRDRYGCDITIQLRRYETFEKMLPTSIMKGNAYSSFEVQLENWFDTYSTQFKIVDEREKRTQMSIMVGKI